MEKKAKKITFNDQSMAYRYYYRIEKITHRPKSEDMITTIKEVKEDDLLLGRILATKIFLDEKQYLERRYSPDSFESYDTKKGVGYNFQLLLIDLENQEKYLVETTMDKMESAVIAQKKEEEAIFNKLGLKYSDFERF